MSSGFRRYLTGSVYYFSKDDVLFIDLIYRTGTMKFFCQQ